MSEEIQRLRAKKKQIGKTLTCQNCFHGVDPPEWVELSDEDQDAIFEEWHEDDSKGWVDLCNMVEAKLKELNT